MVLPLSRDVVGCLPQGGPGSMYVQPQHTGTQVVVQTLQQLPNVSQCHHGHHQISKEDSDTHFVFLFVAEPRHRVVSSVMLYNDRYFIGEKGTDVKRFEQIIKANFSEAVRRFSQWACLDIGWWPKSEADKHPNAATHDIWNGDPNGHGRWNGLPHPLRSFFATGASPDFIGRTWSLQEDLDNVLSILGYLDPAHPSIPIVGTHYLSHKAHNHSWSELYTHEAGACIDRIYACDLPIVAHASSTHRPNISDWRETWTP